MDSPGTIDIGANLLDPMYSGIYHGKDEPYHPHDLENVLERAWKAGVEKILVTAGTLGEAEKAVAFCRELNERYAGNTPDEKGNSTVGSAGNTTKRLFTTVGIHPTRGNEWREDPVGYMEKLEKILQEDASMRPENRVVVAIGECGLDYDRLHFCDKDTQMACFKEHFKLAEAYMLPMFLHSRATEGDIVQVLTEHKDMMPKGGVVHSFDGPLEELEQLLAIQCRGGALAIGINGCSLKTEDNLKAVKRIPLDRLMLETDAPWCGLRASHASDQLVKSKVAAKDKKKWDPECQVKGRNEPCNIVQVVEVVAGVMQVEEDDVQREATKNTRQMFFPDEFSQL
jgi:TatD DNase family protein